MKTVSFPGRFESLPKVGEFVKKAAKSAGLNDKAVYAVQLAVDEACSNIIDHAYGGEGKGEILCSVIVNKDGLTVILKRPRPAVQSAAHPRSTGQCTIGNAETARGGGLFDAQDDG